MRDEAREKYLDAVAKGSNFNSFQWACFGGCIKFEEGYGRMHCMAAISARKEVSGQGIEVCDSLDKRDREQICVWAKELATRVK